MEWYHWLYIFIAIILVIHITFNIFAYKLGIYYEMQSMNDKEIKDIYWISIITIVIILVGIGELFGLFEYDAYGVIFFGLLMIIGCTITKVIKFFVALDTMNKGLPLEKEINNERAYPKKNSMKGLFISAAILGIISGLADDNKKKRRRYK